MNSTYHIKSKRFFREDRYYLMKSLLLKIYGFVYKFKSFPTLAPQSNYKVLQKAKQLICLIPSYTTTLLIAHTSVQAQDKQDHYR